MRSMIKKRKVLLLIPLVILFTIVQFVWSGTTGKISGIIIDDETGDPLPGANVIIEGEALGAASDLDGHFAILNISPGQYTIAASFMGYATLRMENVRVQIDQTTQLNFRLTLQTLEIDEVTVVAERPVIEIDFTYKVTFSVSVYFM